jgi:hypothetical protein
MGKKAQGMPPAPINVRQEDYLLKKLEELRKDCQWLLGLGAAGVFGVVIKDGFGATTPGLRYLTLAVAMLQILTAMWGAMGKWTELDPASLQEVLTGRLRTRYWIRNFAVLLLGASFVLVAVLGWLTPPRA